MTNSPKKSWRWRGPAFCLLLCCGFSAFWGVTISQKAREYPDFEAVYYGTNCLLQGHNPYNESELSAIYKDAGGEWTGKAKLPIQVVTLFVNLPTTFVLVAPFAFLPIALAHALWLAVGGSVLVLASILICGVAGRYAYLMPLLLAGLMLANNEDVFIGGNSALIIVGLCSVATYCIAEDRFKVAGILCLGISLAVKPHDVGWLWLFFVLSGGTRRRCALQALCITASVAAVSLLWVWHVAPQWMSYLKLNLATVSAPGGLNEPGPFSATGSMVDMVIDLQAAIVVVAKNPAIYNAVSYMICGAMLLVWGLRTLKMRGSPSTIWLGIAAAIFPTILITYHRGYDAKLLLLTIPACAMLWSKRGFAGWFAFLFTTAAILFSGDVSLTMWLGLRKHFVISAGGPMQDVFSMIRFEPGPLILLAAGVFYLWVYCSKNLDVNRPA
jgi:hypothetical protein